MPFNAVKSQWDSNPIYQHLRGITANYTEVSVIVSNNVESLCGFYLTNTDKSSIVDHITDSIVSVALQHGMEDSNNG